MTAAPDFTEHNEEVRAVWAAYRAGKPTRVPVTLWADARFYLLDNAFNPGEAITFQKYSQDADVMIDVQLRSAAWRAEHIAPCCDDVAGLPDQFVVAVDQLRYFDAGFFGAPVEYRDGQMPDTRRVTEWNLMMAGATLTTLPLIVIFFAAQKYFLEGIKMTGLKG